MSLIDAEDGKVHIDIPAERTPTGAAPKVVFADPHSTAAIVAGFGEHWPMGPSTTEADARALWDAARTSTDANVKRAATVMALAVEQRSDTQLGAEERALAVA